MPWCSFNYFPFDFIYFLRFSHDCHCLFEFHRYEMQTEAQKYNNTIFFYQHKQILFTLFPTIVLCTYKHSFWLYIYLVSLIQFCRFAANNNFFLTRLCVVVLLSQQKNIYFLFLLHFKFLPLIITIRK